MAMTSNGPGTMSENFAELEIKKYLRLLKKRKWLVAITSLIVFMGWLAFVIMYQSRPTYSATTLVHFQDKRSMSAVEGRPGMPESLSKATLLETNRLLGQIVEELQLSISLRNDEVSKNDIFNYLQVNSESVAGEYRLQRTINNYQLYYSDEDQNIRDSLLGTYSLVDTVQINKFAFQLNKEYLTAHPMKKLEFVIKRPEEAIESLRGRISYQLDRFQTSMTITVTHKSPVMAAKIANLLTERFVQLNLKMSHYQDDEVLRILENQLQIAKHDLDMANLRLQEFKEKFPWVKPPAGAVTATETAPPATVVITPGAGSPVATITSLEQDKNQLQVKINDIDNILSELNTAATLDEKLANTRELLSYLNTEGIPVATAYLTELTSLTTERNSLLANYAPSHRFVTENQSKIDVAIQKVVGTAREYIGKLGGNLTSLENNIGMEKYKLQRLPKKEREVVELIIDQNVKRVIYETVLTKYNEGKIKKEVAVGDVLIADYAVVPPLQGRLAVILKKSLLGLVLAIGMGVGLAIVVEFFDKTVQNSEDLKLRLNLPVVGSIPVILDDSEVPDNIKDIKGKRDTKLITLDYSPTLESESYRDLRTKLLFNKDIKNQSSFLITSLRPGEGKSLTASNLAITFAQQKISTVLVDADLRRGVLHNVYGNKKKPGLSDFLISKATLDYENVNKLIQKTFIPNLHLITTGSPIPNPTEMLGSDRMTNLLNILKSRFGMVILDTAPFQASSDAPILASHVGAVLIVVRADYTNVDLLNLKLIEYSIVREKLVGLVLNMAKVDMKKERYQYSYYNY